MAASKALPKKCSPNTSAAQTAQKECGRSSTSTASKSYIFTKEQIMNNRKLKISDQIKLAAQHIQTKKTAANLAAYIKTHKFMGQICRQHIQMMGGGR